MGVNFSNAPLSRSYRTDTDPHPNTHTPSPNAIRLPIGPSPLTLVGGESLHFFFFFQSFLLLFVSVIVIWYFNWHFYRLCSAV